MGSTVVSLDSQKLKWIRMTTRVRRTRKLVDAEVQ